MPSWRKPESDLVILEFAIAGLADYKITRLPNYKIIAERVHGKHDKTQQRRTQEDEAHRSQETQGGQAVEAPRLSSWVEEAEGQEVGPRPGEALNQKRSPPCEKRVGWGALFSALLRASLRRTRLIVTTTD